MLSLPQLKQLHSQGMDYTVKNTPWFFPAIKDLVTLQKNYVQNTKTLNEFMSAVSIAPPSFQAAFDVPEPVCDNCLLATTNPQYGQGNYGWYFFVGNFYLTGKPMAYNITFARVEIAPPGAVTLQDRNEAVRWMVMGGYGTGPEDWVNIPYDFIYMKYNKLSYSTFTLESDLSQPGEHITRCSLSSLQPMVMEFNVEFTDLKGGNHAIHTIQISRTPPQRNAAQGLTKFGLPGLASLYWSYTNMDVDSMIDNTAYTGGKGWMDHQTFKIAGVQEFQSQVFYTVVKTLIKPKPINWTWMFVQDEESGIQYMFAATLPDGYNDSPSTFKPGLVIKPNSCNVYEDAVPYNKPPICSDARIEVTEVQTVDSHPYPLEFKITLPGGKVVISRAVYGLNLFMNPTGQISCESVGVVYDSTGKKEIGYSVLEVNGPLSNNEVSYNLLKNIGVNPADQSAVNIIAKGQNQEQPTSRKVVAWLIFLIPLFLVVMFLIIIFARKDDRGGRFALCVALAMVLYAVSVMVTVSRSGNKNVIISSLPQTNQS